MDYIGFAKVLDDIYNDFVEGKISVDLSVITEEELKKNIIKIIEKTINKKES